MKMKNKMHIVTNVLKTNPLFNLKKANGQGLKEPNQCQTGYQE